MEIFLLLKKGRISEQQYLEKNFLLFFFDENEFSANQKMFGQMKSKKKDGDKHAETKLMLPPSKKSQHLLKPKFWHCQELLSSASL
uniref:Candidate secreted effector n=1 Tax=Meloidogyne incognita TaxID=6306 RepID=A0A914KVU8_MELIC